MAYEATYRNSGEEINYTPSGADVDAGDVVVLDELIGIAKTDIADGVEGSLTIEGRFTVAKEGGGGVTFAQGALVYWDDTGKVAVATDGGGANNQMGKAIAAAADADTTVEVKLIP